MKWLLPLLLASAGQLVFAQKLTVLPSDVRGIRVTGFQSPDFKPLADKVLGDSLPPATGDWLPYSIAVTNNTAQAVVGLAMRCSVTDADGVPLPAYRLNTIPAFQNRTRFNVIKPGETAVVLPIRILFPSTPMVSRDVSSVPNQAHQLQFLKNAAAVEISLDGVVFDTGQFAGPDTEQEYEEAVSVSSARQNMASAILGKRAAGETVSSIADWLTAIVAQAAPAARGRGAADQSPSFDAATAQLFLAVYRGGGEQQLYATALSYEKPSVKLHR